MVVGHLDILIAIVNEKRKNIDIVMKVKGMFYA
jgi:hypothetical protein